MSDGQAAFAAQTISVVGRNNRIFEAAGGSGGNVYWIREMPLGDILHLSLVTKKRAYWTMTDEQKMQDSLVREAQQPKPVIITYEPGKAKIPDPFTPQAAKSYILHLREGYEKAAAALEDEKHHAQELQEQLDGALTELRELRSMSAVEWAQVGNELRQAR